MLEKKKKLIPINNQKLKKYRIILEEYFSSRLLNRKIYKYLWKI